MATLDPWEVANRVLPHCRTALLYGPPGVGKTHAAFASAKSADDVHYVCLTDETPPEDLRGFYVPRPTPHGTMFEWVDGPVTAGFVAGGLVVLDEIDHAPRACLSLLHGLLHDPEFAVLHVPGQEPKREGSGFRCIATMNGVPSDLSEALSDRFEVALYIPDPHADAVDRLTPESRGLFRDLRTSYKGIGEEIRPVTLRRCLTFDYLRQRVSTDVAAYATFGSTRYVEIERALAVAGITSTKS